MSNTTDQTTNFKNEDGGQEGSFEGNVLVDFAPLGLECAEGKEVRGAVPRNVVELLEVIGDFGDGGCDDGLSWES